MLYLEILGDGTQDICFLQEAYRMGIILPAGSGKWTEAGGQAVFVRKSYDLSFQEAAGLLENGKHILMEGVSGFSCEQVLELADKAQVNQVTFLESLCITANQWISVLRREMHQIGRICRAAFSSCGRSAGSDCEEADMTSLYEVDFSHGALRERGAECIYLMLKCFGQPDTLLASPVFCENGMDIAGCVLGQYKNMRGEILYSTISGSHVPGRIWGENGRLEIKDIHTEPRIIFCDEMGKETHMKDTVRVYGEDVRWTEAAVHEWLGCMRDPVWYVSYIRDMQMLHEALDRIVGQAAPAFVKEL